MAPALRHAFHTVVMLVGSLWALAADATDDDEPRRWSVQVDAGGAYGAMARFEPAMRAAGFDKTDTVFGSSFPTPRANDDGVSWIVGVHDRVTAHVALGIEAFGSPLGTVTGANANTFEAFLLTVEGSVSGAAALVSFEMADPLGIVSARVGIGPAWYFVSMTQPRPGAEQPSTSENLGLLVDADLRFPARTRVFGSVLVQYRYVGEVRLGPYSQAGLPGRPAQVFPASTGAPDHWVLAFGFGVRM